MQVSSALHSPVAPLQVIVEQVSPASFKLLTAQLPPGEIAFPAAQVVELQETVDLSVTVSSISRTMSLKLQLVVVGAGVGASVGALVGAPVGPPPINLEVLTKL